MAADPVAASPAFAEALAVEFRKLAAIQLVIVPPGRRPNQEVAARYTDCAIPDCCINAVMRRKSGTMAST
jgi:hypothetical protein